MCEGAAAVGLRLDQLDLDQLDVELKAVRRRGFRRHDMTGDFVIDKDDVLVLLGRPDALGRAEYRILNG